MPLCNPPFVDRLVIVRYDVSHARSLISGSLPALTHYSSYTQHCLDDNVDRTSSLGIRCAHHAGLGSPICTKLEAAPSGQLYPQAQPMDVSSAGRQQIRLVDGDLLVSE